MNFTVISQNEIVKSFDLWMEKVAVHPEPCHLLSETILNYLMKYPYLHILRLLHN